MVFTTVMVEFCTIILGWSKMTILWGWRRTHGNYHKCNVIIIYGLSTHET